MNASFEVGCPVVRTRSNRTRSRTAALLGVALLLACATATLSSAAARAQTAAQAAHQRPTITYPRSEATPVVLWHGLGDSCCNPDSIGRVQEAIEERLPGVFVYSIATGSSEGESSDRYSSFFGNVNDQVAKVCEDLAAVPELADGYNAVGFSQGGQFLRAVAERCGHTGPKMRTLVTMGAQHQGVSASPGCGDASSCLITQRLINFGAYIGWIQNSVVPAQYYKDPNNMDGYLKASIFIADINNERDNKNTTYADNLKQLESLVLVRFTEDTTVVPKDSAWFSWWDPSGAYVVEMKDTPLYVDDWIGLRSLDEDGKVHFVDCPGEHMQFDIDWFLEEIVTKHLSSAAKPNTKRSLADQ